MFKCTYRANPKDFSRERKMGFKDTLLFMLNMAKKSMQLELDNFFDKVLGKDFSVTKQAYHEARQKIKPEIFIAIAKVTIFGVSLLLQIVFLRRNSMFRGLFRLIQT